MHIHVLGICGTFMASIARLAKQLGHDLTGCDSEVYPPMNGQLEELGIELVDGYHPKQLQPTPDLIIVGNALSRGNPCIEHMLDNRMPYISGPQWLGDNVLFDRHVLAISGTHGKTTTTAMLTFILNSAGLSPGYLIGGVPIASDSSADLGDSEFFVVEADEYDSAFFDKRSKFLHYHSNTLVINNIEYDHADIFGDLESIKKQFHHLIRTLPESGTVIFPAGNEAIESVLEAGCWSNQSRYGHLEGDWRYHVADQSAKFEILRDKPGGPQQGKVDWLLSGRHNVYNGVAAVMAAYHAGVSVKYSCEILSRFPGVKRRMETLYDEDNFVLYDDFAHHPTAIETTLAGLRQKVGKSRIVAVIEPRSASMRLGVHNERLGPSVASADHVLWYCDNNVGQGIHRAMGGSAVSYEVIDQSEMLLNRCLEFAKSGTHMVVMSNGGFQGLQATLVECLKS